MLDGVFRAGAARVDITPALGVDLAGWSRMGGRAERSWGRLFANILVLDDGLGEVVALVSVDLHAGGRPLLERAAARAGLHPGRVFLAGTHTHGGPGHFYGNTLYDDFATRKNKGLPQHRDASLVADLGDRIGDGIIEALGSRRPARVGAGSATGWYISRNRSFGAFCENGRVKNAGVNVFLKGWVTGMGGGTVTGDKAAIDPRARVIYAEGTDKRPIGVFAVFGAHGVAFAAEDKTLTADWFCVATRVAATRAALDWSVPVGLCAGTIGDADPQPLADRGEELALAIGEGVGEVLGQAIRNARTDVRARPRLRVAYAPGRSASESPVGPGFTEQLASEARLGLVSAGGSELGQTPVVSLFVKEGKVRRAMRASPDPHWPKVTLECLQPVIVGDAEPPPALPLRIVRIGECMLVGVPGEPTTMFAESVERELGTMHSAKIIVAGVCGEYCGYLTTTEEYVAQHYEGSSTIWGRSTHAWMRRHLARLAADPAAGPPRSTGRASPIGSRRSAGASSGPASVDPRFEARVKGGFIVGSWRSAKDAQPSLGPGPWLAIEVAGKRARFSGAELTDQVLRTSIERRVGLDRCRWEFEMEFPAEVRQALEGKPCRLRLLPAEFGLGRGPVSEELR